MKVQRSVSVSLSLEEIEELTFLAKGCEKEEGSVYLKAILLLVNDLIQEAYCIGEEEERASLQLSDRWVH